MKPFYLLAVLLGSLSAQAAIQGEFDYAIFQTPDSKGYIETYLFVEGKSLVFKKNDQQQKQAQAEISMIFSAGDKVVAYDKYVLNSQTIADTVSYVNLVDLKRNSLPSGTYHLEISLKDLNDANAVPQKLEADIIMPTIAATPSISDIMLVESYQASSSPTIYTKNGYDFIPNALAYYPSGMKHVRFYAEIYNTLSLSEPDFLTVYYIKRQGDASDKVVSNLRKVKRSTAQAVQVVVAEFDVSELPSGNYEAVVEIRNKKNELVSQKSTNFQRSNVLSNELLANIGIENTFAAQLSNKDAYFYLMSLYPVGSDTEKEYILRVGRCSDTTLMRQFVFNFWEERMPGKAEIGFNAYKRSVDEVQQLYGSHKTAGYSTDLGRVRLQYGKPDDIIKWDKETIVNFNKDLLSADADKPTTAAQAPLQIWHYYKVQTQANVKFVFENEDYTGRQWKLIHSDVTGEVKNNGWDDKVRNRVDNTKNHGMKSNSGF
ncbi:MAG: GWxTD domain-containing protein [Chitinophagales bacterium]|nr:GWxTD domain-containing protein [Chitinophagales bacterium]